MADSYFEYTGTPTGTTFTFPFRFIAQTDVHLLGFSEATSVYTDLDSLATVTANANNQGGTVTLPADWNSANEYNSIRIFRATSTTQLVDFENGSRLTATDLDNAYQQSLYVAQEVTEDANTFQFKLQKNLQDTALTTISNFRHTDLVGDGTATEFALDFTPVTTTPEAYLVSIDGAVQSPNAYEITIANESTITFSSVPPASSVITVVTLVSSNVASTIDNSSLEIDPLTNQVAIKDDAVSNDQIEDGSLLIECFTNELQEQITGAQYIEWDNTTGNIRIGEGVAGSNIWKDVDLRGVISVGQRGADSNFGFIHQDASGDGICMTGLSDRIATEPDLTVQHGGNVVLGKGLRLGTYGAVSEGVVLNKDQLKISASNNVALEINRDQSGAVVNFKRAGTNVGQIQVQTSSTQYLTSSDYRLKESLQDIEDADEKVLSLKPINFKWKGSDERTDGFLAHEVQAVVPEAVSGEKDGEEMQGIDQSKLVPLLTAALQDALKSIKSLEERVTALES